MPNCDALGRQIVLAMVQVGKSREDRHSRRPRRRWEVDKNVAFVLFLVFHLSHFRSCSKRGERGEDSVFGKMTLAEFSESTHCHFRELHGLSGRSHGSHPLCMSGASPWCPVSSAHVDDAI